MTVILKWVKKGLKNLLKLLLFLLLCWRYLPFFSRPTPNLEPRVSLLPFRRSKRGKKTDRSHYAENGAFWKRSSNAPITGSRKTWAHPWELGLITGLSRRHCFRKTPFSKRFPSTPTLKAGVFKFLQFEERFRKAPFSWRISVDGRPNRRKKAAFSNLSGLKSVFVPN